MESSYKKLTRKRDETIFIIKSTMREIKRIQKEYREKDPSLEKTAYTVLLGDTIKALQELYEIE